MESKAKVLDIHKDWQTKKYQIVLLADQVTDTFTGDVRVIIKPWREKRSLDANGYMWALISQMADLLDSSKDEVYEDLIREYGVLYQDDNGYVIATLRADVDINRVQGHWRLYKSNDEWNAYLMIKGTSEYDTSEMSRFLDRVIEEAKALGIETATPDEMERIKGYEKQRAC